jgi:hypothetical protein
MWCDAQNLSFRELNKAFMNLFKFDYYSIFVLFDN